MEILSEVGDPNVAVVYIGKTSRGNIVEFVESVPTYNPAEKWVLIVSSLNGCPVGCKMCDAGFFYRGRLSVDELMEQIEYPIQKRWNGKPKTRKFKVQFARMGEPSFNMAVIEAMRILGERYENFYPSLSTIAPIGTDRFFEALLELKKEAFPTNFQLQFSIHSTNPEQRDEIIPVRKWDFEKIAEYGKAFYDDGGKKITLNFALARENEADASIIAEYFPKEYFLIKITPLNPTVSVLKNRLTNDVDLETGLPMKHRKFVDDLRRLGYDVIISVGDTRENLIGSNCGQYILRFLKERPELREAYTFARGFDFRVS
ncbi:radical SAM protein [Thermococcus thioreducens]|uniref:23S rRNA (Adenine2503-C2)-methyltransferase n=1 Tax=Thermococcus thioreducens TaxID=277988 RepID=A0A0Q2M3H7_9EURY|nr:radical SAM protein [Thermococcus thioreducens]ASJ12508.1 radical SAM protein [Thermococcus thioreducens]KQH82490.1 radical SAM protein [Thermococcus thioreducens]SEV89613.1 23S rRNA (adenine2503-C2)-methyltransferase [Thermococcus thioreducens]